MAAPITHIVLANKIYKKYFEDKDPQRFFVGTSFPDIRYLGGITREETHTNGLKISQLQILDSFEAGLKFHSLVDEIREAYVLDQGVYEIFEVKNKDVWVKQASIKVLEDYLLYDEISDWDKYLTYFSSVLKEEISYGIKTDAIKKWHNILREYIKNRKFSDFLKGVGFDKDRVAVFEETFESLKDNEGVCTVAHNFYTNFEDLLK